jgi:hypothetical protein
MGRKQSSLWTSLTALKQEIFQRIISQEDYSPEFRLKYDDLTPVNLAALQIVGQANDFASRYCAPQATQRFISTLCLDADLNPAIEVITYHKLPKLKSFQNLADIMRLSREDYLPAKIKIRRGSLLYRSFIP